MNNGDFEPGKAPTACLSYSWDSPVHRQWVGDLASRLRADGVELILDHWHLRPGDQLPEFMEKAVRESDYVLIVCTVGYKEKGDSRSGGVGYEGHIITGELLVSGNQRKFIPLLREGNWIDAAPSWLLGKFYLDFRGDPYPEASYEQLLDTLHGLLPHAPAVRPAGGAAGYALAPEAVLRQTKYTDFINAAVRAFHTANKKFVLFKNGTTPARVLMGTVQSDLDAHAGTVNGLLQEINILSSSGVRQAAGEVAGWVLAAQVASMAPHLEPQFKEAHQKFIGESIPKFRDAVRQEAGLR